MPLEMPGDETVLGADEMQHLDHRLVGRHRAARGERDERIVAAIMRIRMAMPMPTAVAVMARMRSIQPR